MRGPDSRFAVAGVSLGSISFAVGGHGDGGGVGDGVGSGHPFVPNLVSGLKIENVPAVPVAVCMIVLVTFGEILSMPFMNSYWIARTQPSNRGQYAALYTMAWSAAQTLGPMGGARVADKMGFNILWWSMGGICFIASFFFYRMLRQANKKAGYETGL